MSINVLAKLERTKIIFSFEFCLFFKIEHTQRAPLNMSDNTVVKKEEESFALRFWRDLVAGTAGGVAQTLSGHPLDTLKVRLQTMPTPAPGEPPMVSSVNVCFLKKKRST